MVWNVARASIEGGEGKSANCGENRRILVTGGSWGGVQPPRAEKAAGRREKNRPVASNGGPREGWEAGTGRRQGREKRATGWPC